MGICVHLVDLVDDCPECKELMLLRKRVESLQSELNSAKQELNELKNEQKKKHDTVFSRGEV